MHNKHISIDNYGLSSRNTHEKLMNFQDAYAKARKKAITKKNIFFSFCFSIFFLKKIGNKTQN
jgi:hypothetical protein